MFLNACFLGFWLDFASQNASQIQHFPKIEHVDIAKIVLPSRRKQPKIVPIPSKIVPGSLPESSEDSKTATC